VATRRDEQSSDVVRGLSFGSVANQYERYRLDYPGELVDVVVRYAGAPLRSALVVGAGTGKATRLFASRGIAVTALDTDAEMADVLDSRISGEAGGDHLRRIRNCSPLRPGVRRGGLALD